MSLVGAVKEVVEHPLRLKMEEGVEAVFVEKLVESGDFLILTHLDPVNHPWSMISNAEMMLIHYPEIGDVGALEEQNMGQG
jgi:hypothetical protein